MSCANDCYHLTSRYQPDLGKLKLAQSQRIDNESLSPALAGVELTIDIVSGAITGGERFFSTYEINTLEAWLQAILEEDRETVQQLLLHPDLETPHTLYYRVVNPLGVICSVEHVILSRFDGGIRTELRQAKADQSTGAYLPFIYLKTIAIQHGLQLENDAVIHFPQVHRLVPILKEIRECLRVERIETSIDLSAAIFEPACSLCGAIPAVPATFSLTFTNLTLSRADLGVLVNEDHSLFRIGAQSPWKVMLNHLHRAGLHVVVGVTADDLLFLTLGADQVD